MFLNTIAVVTGSITGLTTVSTLFNQVQNLTAAILLSIAAVALDLFKYAGYPLALNLYDTRRKSLAFLVIFISISFSTLTFYSTYSKVADALTPSSTNSLEVANLQKASAEAKLSELSVKLNETKQHSEKLTLAGNLKGASLKDAEVTKISEQLDTQRNKVIEAAIAVEAAKKVSASSLSPTLVQILSLLFSVTLELVPIVVLLVNRKKLTTSAAKLSNASKAELNQLAVDDYISTFEKGQKVVATTAASTLNLPLDTVKSLLESSTKAKKSGRFYVKL